MTDEHFTIRPEWFYTGGKKTKMNWFLFEVALEYQQAIAQDKALASYRNTHSPKDIAQFCTYFSKRMEKSALEGLAGKTDAVVFYEDYVTDYYPHIPRRQTDALLTAAIDAWDGMLAICETCPERCISERSFPSTLFDSYLKDGLL